VFQDGSDGTTTKLVANSSARRKTDDRQQKPAPRQHDRESRALKPHRTPRNSCRQRCSPRRRANGIDRMARTRRTTLGWQTTAHPKGLKQSAPRRTRPVPTCRPHRPRRGHDLDRQGSTTPGPHESLSQDPERLRRPTRGAVRAPAQAHQRQPTATGSGNRSRRRPPHAPPPAIVWPSGADALRSPRSSFGNSIRLPLSGFTHSWTLSSEFFSTFPRGTCSLSVSWSYLAFGGVYHQLWAVLSNNPTPGEGPLPRAAHRSYGPCTLYGHEETAFDRIWTSACVNMGQKWPFPNTTFLGTRCNRVRDSVLGWSRFARRYSGNHGCFLFLRLLICLNSAGSLTWSEVN